MKKLYIFGLTAILSLLGSAISGPTLALSQTTVGDSFASQLLVKDGAENILNLWLKPVPRCSFGDLNAIIFDLLSSPVSSTKLLLTVEEIYPARSSPLVVEDITNPTDLSSRGKALMLRLPDYDQPRLLGISICKNSDGSNTCLDKQQTPISEIIKHYAGSPVAENYRAPDRIYYFRPVVLHGDKIHYPVRGLTAESYQYLDKLFKPLGRQQRLDLRDGLNLVKLLGKKLGSKSFRQKNDQGELLVMLPYFERQKCG